MNKLTIISNERVSVNSNKEFKSTNLDLKVLPDELNLNYDVTCIFRKSQKEQNHLFDLKNIKAKANIFTFLLEIIKTVFIKNNRYLIVAISPYTFLSFIILIIFRKNIFIYLMSNGYEEYKHILGNKFVWIYSIMFNLITKFSKVIVCHERLYDKEKSFLVSPSRLKPNWFQNISVPQVDKPKFLYVGRINPEKGIENFINLFSSSNINGKLSIAGNTDKLKIHSNKINLLGYVESEKELINKYDENNISILPSYTEAHPYVLEESLARKRPIIIFEDISYVKKDKIGVFVIKRNIEELISITNYILKNYSSIQQEMDNNKLPTMEQMIKEFSNILG